MDEWDKKCPIALDIDVEALSNKVKRSAQDKLLDDMAEILKVSKCPNCDGGGAIGHEVENYMYSDSGEPIPNHYTEWEQCQWCYEKEDLLTRYRALKGE